MICQVLPLFKLKANCAVAFEKDDFHLSVFNEEGYTGSLARG